MILSQPTDPPLPAVPPAKRVFDLCLALPGVVLLSPLLLLLALLVRLAYGSPILFRQVRPGFLGKPFKVYKFRSMTDQRDDQGSLLPDDLRLTRLGRLLRSTSLDELPELFNVLRGEMSLVGPRPLLMQYLGRYSPEQARRQRPATAPLRQPHHARKPKPQPVRCSSRGGIRQSKDHPVRQGEADQGDEQACAVEHQGSDLVRSQCEEHRSEGEAYGGRQGG